MQNMALDRILEMRAMGADDPVRIGRSLDELRRHRIAGGPKLHRLVISAYAQHKTRSWDRSRI